jgi:formate hydrogenlyase subunit 3/multisubunit Na+/H+ antiporter MnhD subunit
MHGMIPSDTTASGFLLVLAIMLPVMGILFALVLGGRHAERIALVLLPFGFALAAAVFLIVYEGGIALVYNVGAWHPPLGIALRADGIAAAMMVTTAVVIGTTALFAHGPFSQPPTSPEARAPLVFWILLLAIWSAMNIVVLGRDFFTLYVALELLTFAAVPLVSLNGQKETIRAALRYLIFALCGSALYLLGAAILYGAYGTLDISLLSSRARPEPLAWIAVAFMTTGLLAKAALFPFHFWLPPAHAGAPAAGSAVLSALVVKAAFFLIVRLWFDAVPGLMSFTAAQFLAALGSAAILFGSILAMRQKRLKLLVAYSTVAQIGYLFFIFALAGGFADDEANRIAWTGGWIQLFSHAFAKTAMFMAAGLIAEALGHDRIANLDGIGRALPVTLFAFGLAGLSLVGVPPSGGFAAKRLLLLASAQEGQWWWALVMLAGGLLAGGYIFIVLGKALSSAAVPLEFAAVSRTREVAALTVALCAVLLGFVPLGASDALEIGRPATADLIVR